VKRLAQRVTQRWAIMGLAAKMWWIGITAVGLAAVLVAAAATVVETPRHPASSSSAASKNAGSVTSSAAGSTGGMAMSGSPGDVASTASAPVCSNVKGATVMGDGMVMAPVPSGPPMATQQAAADQLVAATKVTLAKYASLAAATAAGYTPATNPNGYLVHYANWQIARTDGFDPFYPAFLMYANTVNGPELMGAMYLGPAPCTPGPDIGGSLTQWHAHDNLCLSGGQVVGRTTSSGTCTSGVHNTNTYFMLHVWTEPSLAATHQFQPDLTRAELAPIIDGNA
jgi:hypothetical protein